MYRALMICMATAGAIALNTAVAFAADEGHEHHADAKRVGDAYPLAVDPLGDSLAEARHPVVMQHEGRELRFASEANAEKFKADPAKYLADVDAKLIEQQKPRYAMETCVISGGKLGAMGEPVDVVVGNRLVRLCCAGCKGKLAADPAKHIATIDKAVVEAQKKDYPLDTCVVSGEKFGGEMGEPIDYVIANRLVRFCCKGCVKMFEKDPAKYLAKIDAHMKHEGDGEHGEGAGHGEHNGHDGHGDNH